MNFPHIHLVVNGARYSIPYESFGGGVMKIRMENETTVMSNYEQYFNMKAKNWGVSVGLTLYGMKLIWLLWSP